MSDNFDARQMIPDLYKYSGERERSEPSPPPELHNQGGDPRESSLMPELYGYDGGRSGSSRLPELNGDHQSGGDPLGDYRMGPRSVQRPKDASSIDSSSSLESRTFDYMYAPKEVYSNDSGTGGYDYRQPEGRNYDFRPYIPEYGRLQEMRGSSYYPQEGYYPSTGDVLQQQRYDEWMERQELSRLYAGNDFQSGRKNYYHQSREYDSFDWADGSGPGFRGLSRADDDLTKALGYIDDAMQAVSQIGYDGFISDGWASTDFLPREHRNSYQRHYGKSYKHRRYD